MNDTVAPWRALETAEFPDDGVTEGTPRARRFLVIAGFAVAAMLGVVAFLLAATGNGSAGITVASEGRPAPSTVGGTAPSPSGMLVVQVVGAVRYPGVYSLPPGSRAGDAVEAAGGYSARLDAPRAATAINLAAKVADGDQIRVPSRDDGPTEQTAAGGVAVPAASGGIVHLNTATAAQLDSLPGIGPVTAAKILASRDEQPFGAVDDLRTRKLVGASTFDKIRGLVAVP